MVRPMTEGSTASSNALFTEVKRMRSSDDVVDQIRGAILSGRLKTGDRLPNERDLCVVFGVSRATLREGLRTLEALGAIEIRPGAAGGIFAMEPQADQVGAALESLLRFRHVTAEELAEFRTSFEGETAHWAALRATEEDVERLLDLAEQFIVLADVEDMPWRTLAALDIAFHQAMAEASKNQVRVAIMLGIHRALHQASNSIADEMTPPARRSIGKELRGIVAAIEHRDAPVAKKLMRRHVKKFSDLERKVLAAAEAGLAAHVGDEGAQPGEPIGIEERDVLRGLRAGDEVRDETAGDGREREAEHRVTRCNDEVGVRARPPEERQPVGRARPQSAPPVNDVARVEAVDAADARAADSLDAALVQREVEAAELERPREPQPVRHRRHDDACLLQEERHARVALGVRVVDVVALAGDDREREAEPPRQPRRPDPGGEDERAGVEGARVRLEPVDATAVRGECVHFDAGSHGHSRRLGRAGDRLDERERIAGELVRVVHRAGDGPAQRRFERRRRRRPPSPRSGGRTSRPRRRGVHARSAPPSRRR